MRQTRISGYTSGGIRCLVGVNIPYDPPHPPYALFPDQVNSTNLSHVIKINALYTVHNVTGTSSAVKVHEWTYGTQDDPDRIFFSLVAIWITMTIRKITLHWKENISKIINAVNLSHKTPYRWALLPSLNLFRNRPMKCWSGWVSMTWYKTNKLWYKLYQTTNHWRSYL
jgi:hypothetical protein